MNFKDIKGLLVIGEKKTFSEITEILELARKANAITLKMLTRKDRSALTAENEDMKQTEKRSDDIAFRISVNITNGAVSSNVLDNLLECVGIADDMIDNYYFVSREINRMALVNLESKSEESVSEFNASFERMLKLADGAMEILQRLLLSSSMEDILELRNEIQKLEEDGDNIKDYAFDRLYSVAPRLHYLEFNHLSELLHKFDDILDSCEDLSDLVVAIITSISK